MKYALLIFILLVIDISETFAQYVSLEEIIMIHNSDYDKINGLLLPRGWSFQGKRISQDSLGTCLPDEIVWAFKPDDYSDRAHSYIALAESKECGKKVTYQTIDINNYNKIRSSITKYKMSLVGSDVGEINGKEYISSNFLGANYKLYLVVYTRGKQFIWTV